MMIIDCNILITNVLIYSSDCSYIYFYEKESESIVQFLRGDENGIVNVLEAHPIYPILATSGLDKDVKIWVPSNENFELNRESLKKCVAENMRNQFETQNSGAAFSVDPSVLELARRFFQRHREEVSPNPLAVYHNSSTESDSD
jgi:DDB1- and CUL4-associated factor 8